MAKEEGKPADDLKSFHIDSTYVPTGDRIDLTIDRWKAQPYPALSLTIRLSAFLAWGFGGIVALVSLIEFFHSPLIGILGFVWAVFTWVFFMEGAELLQLLIRIEENTRPR